MEVFSREEAEKLDEILSMGVEPFLDGTNEKFGVLLGKATDNWLFETRMSLPTEAKEDFEFFESDQVPQIVKIHKLNEILEERQVSSAPYWWELNFFETNQDELWNFIVEQCRKHYDEEFSRDFFDFLIHEEAALRRAINIIRVRKHNSTLYSEEEYREALDTFDRSYPLDFSDYKEAPRRTRSPLEKLQEFIAPELSRVDSVFSKRWFEFKILDEMAAFRSFRNDGSRDSELSKSIEKQLRGMMFGEVLALGRMIEHYRWKFRFEADAHRGMATKAADSLRGKKGGEAKSRGKYANLDCLMLELEKLSDLFSRIDEEAIFRQAYTNAGKHRDMPKSKKTYDNYGTTIRSEEPYLSRYRALVGKKP